MDWVAGKQTIFELLKKYRFAIIVLLAGIALMALPYKEEASENPVPASQEINNQDVPLQEALEEILGKISGAGKVSVLLTQAAGEETLYQTNENVSSDESGNNSRRETVLVSGSGREETGLIRQVKAPTYLGAVIVCQGADNASVRLAVVEAVRSATGLTSDRISVLKMK